MAFIESRKKAVSLLLALSLSGMSNLACLAAGVEATAKAPVPLWQEAAALKSGVPLIQGPQAAKSGAPIDVVLPLQQAPFSVPVTESDDSASARIDKMLADDVQQEMEASLDKKSILKSPLLLASAPAPSLETVASQADSLQLSAGTSISAEEACARIDQLTKRILLKEIELERFNLNYTRNVAIMGRWKGWRYTGFQEVNGAMGLTGGIISTAYRGARLENPKAVKPCIQESANYIPMIGSYIGAGAAGMELGINAWHDAQARRHGYGPSESLRKVGALKGEIETMMAEREALIGVESRTDSYAGVCELDAIEGKVLRDMLDQSLQEFERFHVGARRVIAFQQMQYFLDFSKYIINSLGYQFAYLSLHRHRRRYNGNAGALWMVAGGIYMGAPIVSRMFGKTWAELTRYKTEKVIGHQDKATTANLQADLARLDEISKRVRVANAGQVSAERCTDRIGHYAGHEVTYSNEIRAAEKARNKAVLTATQNVGAALYVGGTKEAQGIIFGIAGFNHLYNAGSKSSRSNRVTNDLLFAASVISIPATTYSMLDSLRIQVMGEINRHKLKAKGELPSQITTKRLAQLDEMEKKLKSAM